MVKGIDRFRDYFRDFTDQYVLIGGAACDMMNVTDLEIRNLKLHGVKAEELRRLLIDTYVQV